MPQRLIIDTDPGIDDALAILLTLASSELQLEGLSIVHGNCSMQQGARNARAVLELAGASHIPVFNGCELPLVQPSLLAPETHGNTGLGYAELPDPVMPVDPRHAVDFMIETVLASPGEITIAAIGPLTNVALAIRKEPRFAPAVKDLFIMGGAVRYDGNTTPLAEFNTYVDPHAAHIVFHSGIPIMLVPLDVTYQCILTPEDVTRLQASPTGIPKFIADSTRFYMEFHDEYQQIAGCVINDPLALALIYRPEICDYEEIFVDVEISGGVAMGKTFGDFYKMTKRSPNMRVALQVRPRDFMELFLERIESLCQAQATAGGSG